MNRLLLQATLAERGALRFTPADLPALDLALRHESLVSEDGHPRKVSFELKAVAIGEVTRLLSTLALGSAAQFAGFIAATRNGRGLLFHITSLEPLPGETPTESPVSH